MSLPFIQPIAVIPARFNASRFPGKPLAVIAGKPMIEHVYLRCKESAVFSRIVVATDDERIADVVRSFGGEALMTSADCTSGTDRVAEVARAIPTAEVLINVQGDEPLISPVALAALTEAFTDSEVSMATLVRPIEEQEFLNSNVVKVVLGLNRNALYFSRAPIPFARSTAPVAERLAHVGIYGYRRETLLKISTLQPTPLEETEMLEQLRALEHGIPIRCIATNHSSIAVDTPEDRLRVEEWLARNGRPPSPS